MFCKYKTVCPCSSIVDKFPGVGCPRSGCTFEEFFKRSTLYHQNSCVHFMLYLILVIVIVVVEFSFGCDWQTPIHPPLGVAWGQCEIFRFDASS